MAETVEVVFAHHWTDRRDPAKPKDVKPGETVSLEVDVARQVVNARVAVYATKKAAEAAGNADGPIAVTAEDSPLSSKTKDELVALAEAHDPPIDSSGTKAEIIERLAEADETT